MKFPLNYPSTEKKVKKHLKDDEFYAAIELLNRKIQGTRINPIIRAKVNGILQSFHTNELAGTRKLLVPDDNRKMLRRNLDKVIKDAKREYWIDVNWAIIKWSFFLFSISLLIYYIYSLVPKENEIQPEPIALVEDVFPIKQKKKTPRHIWEAEIREEERAQKKRALESQLFEEPIYAVQEYEFVKSNGHILTPKNGSLKKKKSGEFKYAICLASFNNEKNALNFSKKNKSSTVRFFKKNKKYRVLTKVFNSEKQARLNLNKWKKSNSKPWMIKFKDA